MRYCTNMQHRNDAVVKSAIEYAILGIPVLPAHGKAPAIDDWKKKASTNIHTIMHWAWMAVLSFGAVCKDIAVIDTDSPSEARWWFLNMPRTPWMVRTPSGGGHFYYKAGEENLRCAVKVKGKYDVRAGGDGYVIIAGSEINKKMYELIGEITMDLPLFDPNWLPKTGEIITANSAVITTNSVISRGEIKSLKSYLAKVESRQGANGSAGLVRACAICRDFGISPAEATIALLEWSAGPTVSPPWSPAEIARAVTRVYAKKGT